MYCMYVCSPIILFIFSNNPRNFSAKVYEIHVFYTHIFLWLLLTIDAAILSAPKAPNRSAVKGLAAAARKRKEAG